MKSSGRNLSLTSYDDLFATDESRADADREKVMEIPLSELFPFKDHAGYIENAAETVLTDYSRKLDYIFAGFHLFIGILIKCFKDWYGVQFTDSPLMDALLLKWCKLFYIHNDVSIGFVIIHIPSWGFV